MLIYDGDCGFCTTTAMRFERRADDSVAVEPWQSLDLDAFGLTEHEVTTAAYWVEPSGRTLRGHLAVGAALASLGGPLALIGRAIKHRPFSWVAAPGYRLVARYRYRLPGSTDACRIPQ